MPDSKVTLQNNETGALEQVDLSRAEEAIKSGKYAETDASRKYVRTGGVAGSQDVATAAAQEAAGAQVESGVQQAGVRTAREQREAFDTVRDKALTFIEGIADAGTMGLVHQPGDQAAMRRDVNAGSAFAGQLVGTLTAAPGAVMSAGRAGGRAAAKAVLGAIEAGSRAEVAAKVAASAVEGAALMGAQSLGTQVSDAVLDDKPFVGEAVLHDLKMGSAFGAGFGLIGAGAERALSRATRSEAAAAGGLADPASAVSQRVDSSVSQGVDSMHSMLDEHAGRVGIADVLANEGAVPKRVAKEYRGLVNDAQRARAKLEGLDAGAALSGSDAKAYSRWRDAMEDYQEKLVAIDERMTPHLRDAAGMQAFEDLPRNPLGEPARPGGELERPNITRGQVANGELSQWDPGVPVSFHLDDMMTPELRARYEELHGHPYETTEEALAGAERPPAGEVSATSENKTNPGKRGAMEPVPAESVRPGTEPGRVLRPRAEPGNRLNEAYSNEELVLRPDGWFQTPAVGTEENAQLFARFQDKMAQDTLAARARKAASVEKFRAGVASGAPVGGPDAVKTSGLGRGQWSPEEREFMEIGKRRNGAPEPAPKGSRTPTEGIPVAGPVKAEPRPTPQESPAARRPGGRRAVRDYVDAWYRQARERSVISPADRSAAALKDVVERIRGETGGALDAAGTVDLLGAQKINPARSSFGTTLDQIHSARQLARAVADVSRGRANPASKAGRNWMVKWMGERVGGRIGSGLGRKALGSVLGGAVGGPAGYVLGAVFADRVMGFAGRAAGAAGRVQTQVLKAAAGLVNTKLPIRAVAAASASRPVPSYLPGEDPISDPLERSMHVRELAANPDAYRAKLRAALGDLPLLHPDVMEPAIDGQVRNVVQLSLRAPMIFWDSLGRPSAQGSQEVRRWVDLEAASHDVMATLAAVGSGTATDSQIEGLRVFHPEAYSRLVAALVADPDKLLGRSRDQLKLISRVAGVPLTPGDDPGFVARQQQAWQVHAAPANGLTAPPPTPAQGGSRQPGNPGVSPSPR